MFGFGRKMAHAREEPVTGQIEPEEPKGTIFMSAGLVDTLFLVSENWNIRYWTALQLNSCSQRLWFERDNFFIVLPLDDAKMIRSLQCSMPQNLSCLTITSCLPFFPVIGLG